MTKGVKQPTVGQYVAKLRASRHMSTRTAAEYAGLDPAWYEKLETDDCLCPSSRALARIATVFDIQPEVLYALAGDGLDADVACANKVTAVRMRLRSEYGKLPPEAVDDLETLFSMLRSYYDIPADQPVFPKRPRTLTTTKRAKPSRTAKNHAKHPWRGAA